MTERLRLSDRDCKAVTGKVLQQAIINMFKNTESFSKETEDVMKKQMGILELKNVITEKKTEHLKG